LVLTIYPMFQKYQTLVPEDWEPEISERAVETMSLTSILRGPRLSFRKRLSISRRTPRLSAKSGCEGPNLPNSVMSCLAMLSLVAEEAVGASNVAISDIQRRAAGACFTGRSWPKGYLVLSARHPRHANGQRAHQGRVHQGRDASAAFSSSSVHRDRGVLA